MKPPPDESLPLFDLAAAAPVTPAPPAPLAALPSHAPEPPADAVVNMPASDGHNGPVSTADDPLSPAPADPFVTSVPSELADWKDDLRRDFETWLAAIEEVPALDEGADDEANDAPDLYSFYEQFAAASAESRKANRRTAEAMSQWGETLARFESGLQPLRDTASQLAAAQPKAGEMSRAHCLMLVELLDRMHRLARAFATPPVAKRSWLGSGADDTWRKAWNAQHDALDILVSHLDGLLQKEGVICIPTLGQTFDPAVMMAVAAEPDATHPPQTVLEEIAAGYSRHGELLRAAQVKVVR